MRVGDGVLLLVVSLVAVPLVHLATDDSELVDDCSPCNFTELDYNFCQPFENTTLNASLVTDTATYDGAHVSITASLILNDDKLFYKFCYTFHVSHEGEVIGCKRGEGFATIEHWWNKTEYGEAKMVVFVYNSSSHNPEDTVACGTLNVTIAENSGVDLNVNAVDEHNNSYLSQDDHYLIRGNITFIPNATITDYVLPVKIHYKYDFGDDSETESTSENVTHYYMQAGKYTFNVDVIAVVNASWAYHDNYTNYIVMKDEVENIHMAINNNDSIPEAVTVDVTISANGSLPITVCWNVEPMKFSLPPDINADDLPGITCDNEVILNTSSHTVEHMHFDQTGDFEFVALFENNVSNRTGRFPFSVVPNPCKNISHLFKKCESSPNVTYFDVDEVIYTGAQSDIVAEVHSNVAENYSELYYSFCSNITAPKLFGWVSGDATGWLRHTWTESGEGATANLLLQVFSSNTTLDRLACATTFVTIYTPDPGGITLDVQVKDDRKNEISPSAFSEDEDEGHYFVAGNITFLSKVNITDSVGVDPNKIYYRYYFGDGSPEMGIHDENNTHCYNDTGRYSYWVEAIAPIDEIKVYHAKHQNYIILQEVVRDIKVSISNNNSVTKGSEVKITISAEGSLPIGVCWRIEKSNSSQPTVSTVPAPPCLANESGIFLTNSSSAKTSQTFNRVGNFEFVAYFENGVSNKMGTFKFKVVPVNNKVVVASTATVVVVMAVLASVIAVILLACGVYIPYRKYKNRMTETANFRFVELNERISFWKKVKVQFWQLRDRFRRSDRKVGLVNLSSEGEVSSTYGSTTVSRFTPHDDL